MRRNTIKAYKHKFKNLTAIMLSVIMLLSGILTVHIFESEQLNAQIVEHDIDDTSITSTSPSETTTARFEPWHIDLWHIDLEPIEATPEPGTEATPGIVEIIFHGNGNTYGTAPESIIIETPSDIVLDLLDSSLAKNDYEFTGWFHPDSVQVVRPGQAVTITGTGTIHLFASWSPLRFNLEPLYEQGENMHVESMYADRGNSNLGFGPWHFEPWSFGPWYSDLWFIELEPIEATPEPDTESMPGIVEIIFHGNGNTYGTAPESITIESPIDIVLNMPDESLTRDGYEFTGWFHPASVQVVRPGQAVTITGTGTIHLFASWNPLEFNIELLLHAQGIEALYEQGIEPLNLNNFSIVSPTPFQQVPVGPFDVRWTHILGASYIISLRNLNTNQLPFDNTPATGSSVPIGAHLTAGQQFRVAMAARLDGVEVWSERTFTAVPASNLSLSMYHWDAPAAGDSTNFSIHTTHNPNSIQASSNVSWLTVSGAGTSRTISAISNNTPGTRTGRITVNIWGEVPQHIYVTQQPMGSGTNPNLSVAPNPWSAPRAGGSTTLTISTNLSGNISVVSNNTTWLTVLAGSGTSRTIHAAANNTTGPRNGSITVSVAGHSQTINVSQPGTSTITNPTITHPEYDNQRMAWINILVVWQPVAGATYTVSLRNLTTGQQLINQLPTPYTNFAIMQNQLTPGHHYRVAISATTGGQTTWSERTFIVHGGEVRLTFHANGGTPATQTRDILPNVVMGLANMPTEPTRTNHVFGGWHNTPNPTGGEVFWAGSVVPSGGGQFWARWNPAPTLIVNPLSWTAPPAGGQTNFTITTNQPNNVSVMNNAAPWITITGSGTTRTIHAAANNTSVQREGNIVVHVSGAPIQSIRVVQGPQVQNVMVTFNPNGGTVSPQTRQHQPGIAIGALPTPTRPGYTFAGWFTTQTDSTTIGTQINSSTIVPSGGATYWARWYVRLTLNPNGGTINGLPIPITVTRRSGDRMSQNPLPIPVGPTVPSGVEQDGAEQIEVYQFENYTYGIEPSSMTLGFMGWLLSGSAGIPSVVPNEDAAFQASWNMANVFRITLNPGVGGVVDSPSVLRMSNALVGILPTPTRSEPGVFIGWFTSGGVHVTGLRRVTGNETFIARWTNPSRHLNFWYPSTRVLIQNTNMLTDDIGTYDPSWRSAIQQSMNLWNAIDVDLDVSFSNATLNTVSRQAYSTRGLLGSYTWHPDHAEGPSVQQFGINLYARQIRQAVDHQSGTKHDTEFFYYVTSVMSHEIGHIFGLEDNPITNDRSVMRDAEVSRIDLPGPTPFDINSFNWIYR